MTGVTNEYSEKVRWITNIEKVLIMRQT